MHQDKLEKLLKAVQNKKTTVTQALVELRKLPFQDVGFAKIDTHRHLRTGFPEVIYCQGKEINEVAVIFAELASGGSNVIATRATAGMYRAIKKKFPKAKFQKRAGLIYLEQQHAKKNGLVAVITGGTSDQVVAEEACITAELFGAQTKRLYDVGVAGVHRLFAYSEVLDNANVLIVVAGMEGALPSVVGGLVDKPVVAVPTSIGYGASFKGVAPLLTMLNSCAAGIVVVNIDNGFGAGYAAGLINRLISGKKHEK